MLLGLVGAAWWNLPEPAEIDEATLCPIPTPAGVHAVLVNRSDPVNPTQRQRVREVLESAVNNAAAGTRVAIYVADRDDVARLTPVLALCSPGTGWNVLYGSPRTLRPRYEQAFREGIAALDTQMVQPAARTLSPVVESIRAVCIDAFGPTPSGIPLQMTIIGDMIQYSALTNHYRDREFEAILGNRVEPLRADCKGAEADIVYLRRPAPRGMSSPQSEAHQRFWDLLLRRMNARPRNLDIV